MAIDYAEKERAFVAALADDTGRSLADWMQALSDADLGSRNDKIDWLRHQGFAFAKASWLERIHHNSGQLIYASEAVTIAAASAAIETAAAEMVALTVSGDVASAIVAEDAIAVAEPLALIAVASGRAMSLPVARVSEPMSPGIITPSTVSEPRVSASVTRLARPPLAVEVLDLLAGAKGLKPLAELIVRDVQRRVPSCAIETRGPVVLFSSPMPFLAVWPQPKRIRVFGAFAGFADVVSATPPEALSQLPVAFPHVVSLDDARRIDDTFAALVLEAARAAGTFRR